MVGGIADGEVTVERFEFGTNVRATSNLAVNEFSSNIAERFGPAYLNEHRGFWCSSSDLLRIHRDADADGLEILGSVHMHPDWHRIGPPAERGLRISEQPTPMDEYMFAMTGWPVNMICYLERRGRGFFHRYAAWQHPGSQLPGARAVAIPVHVRHALVTPGAGAAA
jgi:hypothetical protein